MNETVGLVPELVVPFLYGMDCLQQGRSKVFVQPFAEPNKALFVNYF